MGILCKLFGHVRYAGWWGDGLYGDVIGAGYDGTGRRHFRVRAECDRCGENYTLARFSTAQDATLSPSEGGEHDR